MVNFLGWRGLCGSVLGPAAVASALMVASDAADAHSHVHLTKQAATVHRAEAAYSPPSASIVVDGNTGEVLHAFNADGLRHPASLTKIMTLYLLFERLESGAIKLDTPLILSAHATAQAPSKLGIKLGKPSQSIRPSRPSSPSQPTILLWRSPKIWLAMRKNLRS